MRIHRYSPEITRKMSHNISYSNFTYICEDMKQIAQVLHTKQEVLTNFFLFWFDTLLSGNDWQVQASTTHCHWHLIQLFESGTKTVQKMNIGITQWWPLKRMQVIGTSQTSNSVLYCLGKDRDKYQSLYRILYEGKTKNLRTRLTSRVSDVYFKSLPSLTKPQF